MVGFWYVFMFILAEEIIQMCGNISLSAEEEHGVTLPSMELEEIGKEGHLCLLGGFYVEKLINEDDGLFLGLDRFGGFS